MLSLPSTSNPPINLLPSPLTILSPVSMRAEDEYTVNFTISDLDKETGAYLKAKRTDEWGGSKTVDLDTAAVGGTAITSYDELVKAVVGFKKNSEAADYNDVHLYVYDEKGRFVSSYDSLEDQYSAVQVAAGYTVEIELFVDAESAGHNLGAGRDGVDDRNQAVITVELQHDIDSSLYDRPTSSEYYVVNKGENVAKLIEDGTYDNFPAWNDYTYDVESGKDYVRVYDNALTKVTKDITVKADWAEDKAGLDRFAPAATNDKDTNGDGKVSCDEYYGTTGLEWSDKLNACVVSSTGDAVVTIPNTATK